MNYIYISSLLFLLLNGVICERGLSLTNYTMDFFKELSPISCKEDNDCPDYSNGCYIPQKPGYGICNIYMFCHETDFCLKLSLGEFDCDNYYQWPYYKTQSYDIYNLTMNSCNLNIKEKIKERNKKSNAQSVNIDKLGSITDVRGFDNDYWGIYEDCKFLDCKYTKCFSGKCNEESDICEINESKPGYVCTLQRNNEYYKYSVACLRMNHEPCSYSSDCLSNVCDSQARICVTVDSKLSTSQKITEFFKEYWYLIIIGFFAILIVIGIVSRIINHVKESKKVVLAKMDY